MKALAASLTLLLTCGIAWAQQTKPPDTRSDFLRSESVKAPTSNLRLNLNSAKPAELTKLPGISDAEARAIIKGRPYKSKEELVKKKILPQNVYEDIKGNVFAGG